MPGLVYLVKDDDERARTQEEAKAFELERRVELLRAQDALLVILGANLILPGRSVAQVVANKVVGDTGFEPLASTLCRRQRKKLRRRK